MKTIGEVAVLLGVAQHRVAYIIAAKKINPDARAGRLRMFSDTSVERIRRALAAARVCPVRPVTVEARG